MQVGLWGAGGIAGLRVVTWGARLASRTSPREVTRKRWRGLVPPASPRRGERVGVSSLTRFCWFFPTLCVALPPTRLSDPGTWSNGDLSVALTGHQALG